MSVIRVNKNSNYVTMNKTHFKEKGMSLKAKGLLSEMLSLPDDWDYSIKGLIAINKENETSIKSTLEELKKFKYLVVTKKLPNETQSGRIEYIYDIYEEPQKQEGEKQGVENLGVDFLGVEKQGVENQVQYNNIILNNNKLNNKELNNNIYYIVEYLNNKINSHYKSSTKSTRDKIKARLNEGFTLDDFKNVIDKKYAEWKGTEFEKFLRPETLFGTKFESYLNQPMTKKSLKDISLKELEEMRNETNRLHDSN